MSIAPGAQHASQTPSIVYDDGSLSSGNDRNRNGNFNGGSTDNNNNNPRLRRDPATPQIIVRSEGPGHPGSGDPQHSSRSKGKNGNGKGKGAVEVSLQSQTQPQTTAASSTISASERRLPLALTALTSLEALNGASMPSTFLPSYYPERNHHLLPSYARSPGSGGGRDYGSSHNDDRRGNDRAGSGSGDSGRNYTRDNNTNNNSSSNRHQRQYYRDDYTSEADSRSPNPHLLDGIALSEPLVQSPHGSPQLVIDDDILDFAGAPSTDRDRSGFQRDSEGDKTKTTDSHRDREGNRGDERERERERDKGQGKKVEQPPYKPKDWGWAEIPLYGREDPTAMADIKAAGYLGDLYASKSGPWVNGKDVSAEEYAQALSIYEHLLSALPSIVPRSSSTEQGLQSLIALAAEGMSIVAPGAPLPSHASGQNFDRHHQRPRDRHRDGDINRDRAGDQDRGQGAGEGAGKTVHPPVQGKRGVKEHRDAPVCLGCGATETPEWRRGPMGPRTLCNACVRILSRSPDPRRSLAVERAHVRGGDRSSSCSVEKREEREGTRPDTPLGQLREEEARVQGLAGAEMVAQHCKAVDAPLRMTGRGRPRRGHAILDISSSHGVRNGLRADQQGLVHMKMMRKKRKQEEAQAAKSQKKGERVDGK